MPRDIDPPFGRSYRPTWFQRSAWWIAGGDVDLLSDRRCSGDRGRFTATGIVTLGSAFLAATSGYVIAASYIVESGLAALACAAAWGTFIGMNDRALLMGLWGMADAPVIRKIAANWPRIALALLAAAATGPAIELVVFSDSVTVERQRHAQAQVAETQRALAERYSEIPVLHARLARIEAEVNDAEAQVARAAREAIVESDGSGGSGRRGADILYDIKRAEQQRLESLADRTRAHADRERALLAARLSELTRVRDAELARFGQLARDADDVVADLVALYRLKRDPDAGAIVRYAGWLIWLIAAVAELLPILSALTHRREGYEEAIIARRDVSVAEWRTWRDSTLRRLGAVRLAEQRVDYGSAAVLDRIVDDALAEALQSEAARKAQEEIVAEILANAVPRARRAARDAFGEDFETEVATAAREARRRADERVVTAETHRARVVQALRRVEDWFSARI